MTQVIYAKRVSPGKLPVRQQERDRVAFRVHTALWEMRAGRATREEWSDIADAVNVVEALCVLGKIDSERVMPLITQAITGMVAGIEEIDANGAMSVDSIVAEAMAKVIGEYESAMRRFSSGTMQEATELVLRKIAGQRTNPDSTIQVVG